jgi:hypothetical protein
MSCWYSSAGKGLSAFLWCAVTRVMPGWMQEFLEDMTRASYDMTADLGILPHQPLVDFTRHFSDAEDLEATQSMPAIFSPLPLADQLTCKREPTLAGVFEPDDILGVNGFTADSECHLAFLLVLLYNAVKPCWSDLTPSSVNGKQA